MSTKPIALIGMRLGPGVDELIQERDRLIELHASLPPKIRDLQKQIHQRSAPVLPYGVQLSPRQQQVLTFISEGLSNKEIANKLGISESTAKFHVSQILRKFKFQNRGQLYQL